MTLAIPSGLRPSERLTVSALGLLLATTLALHPGGWPLRAAIFMGLLLGVLRLGRSSGKPWVGMGRDFAPALVVLTIFLLLQPLVARNTCRWDAALAGFDRHWFTSVAWAWRGAFGRPAIFTDAVYLAYASFYLLPITVAVLARCRLGEAFFERVAFTLLLGFYLSFLGYFLWPAEGPRVPELMAPTQLGGGLVSQGIRAFLRGAEATTLDAFPSGHTALSILPAVLATRLFPRLAPLLWAWALAIVFATVYIGVHYIADVVAGLLLAGLTAVLAPLLSKRLGSVG
jgi:membrane-associated phospholipid phosphatase